jgi:hypothetical protein
MRTRSILAAGAALAWLGACAHPTPPAPLQRESAHQVEATVVAVQKAERIVSLRGPDGRTLTVEVGPQVRNFDQIQVGDRVIASYYEAVGFALKKPGEGDGGSDAGLIAGRAKPGDRPAAAVGHYAQTTVTIESVDRKTYTVTFRGEDGLTRAVPVVTPEGRAFASKLKPGDQVEISYEEAVAISVEPGKK